MNEIESSCRYDACRSDEGHKRVISSISAARDQQRAEMYEEDEMIELEERFIYKNEQSPESLRKKQLSVINLLLTV